jgi:hypothetical protein
MRNFCVRIYMKYMQSSGMLRRVALVGIDIPPKRRFLHEPHGVASQKTVFFVESQLLNLQTTLRVEEWCLLGCYAVWLL